MDPIQKLISYHIYSLCGRIPPNFEDCYQEGYIGYMRAVELHDPSHGEIKKSYIAKFVRRAILDYLKKETNYRYRKQNLTENEGEIVDTDSENQLLISKIHRIIYKLSPISEKIVTDMYLSAAPKTLANLAKDLGVSVQRSHQLKNKAIEELKELLKCTD